MELLKNVDDFLIQQRTKGWSESMLERAKSRLAVFVADFSDEDNITQEVILEWESILSKRGLSERTRKEYLTLIGQFLEFCGYEGFRKRRGRPKDLRDRVFGDLTVLEPCAGKRSKERSVIWKCQCSCGKIVEIPANQLMKGYHKSCGCKKAERLREINQFVDGTSLKMVFSDTVRKDNSSGYKGVYRKGDQWGVRIQYKGKRYYLGAYDKIEEAIEVRKLAEEKIREEAAKIEFSN